MKVLVTGATGMVGRALVSRLETRADAHVFRALRRSHAVLESGGRSEPVVLGDITGSGVFPLADLRPDVLVHAAARVHVMEEGACDPLAAYRSVNVEGTLNLARQAAASGTKRFIFVSSVKVNGEETAPGHQFEPSELPRPSDPYAVSKWEAEQLLAELSADSGMEVVILRPPLVYGPGVRANFLRLMSAVDRQALLPFGAVANVRSLIFLGNLVDAIVLCLDHPVAKGKTYLVSDGDDVSTAELVRRIALALGRKPRLLPVPPVVLRLGGYLAGKGREVDRLLGSLKLDSSAIRRDLGWTPPFSMREGLSETAQWYFAEGTGHARA